MGKIRQISHKTRFSARTVRVRKLLLPPTDLSHRARHFEPLPSAQNQKLVDQHSILLLTATLYTYWKYSKLTPFFWSQGESRFFIFWCREKLDTPKNRKNSKKMAKNPKICIFWPEKLVLWHFLLRYAETELAHYSRFCSLICPIFWIKSSLTSQHIADFTEKSNMTTNNYD